MALGFVMKRLPGWHSEEWQGEAAPGVGTVTAVTATSPIASSGGATPDISIIDSGVIPDTYGDATHVPQFDVSDKGIITNATPVAIAFPAAILAAFGPLQFTANGAQSWIGGDPVWLMAANADKSANDQGYRFIGWGQAATRVALQISLFDHTYVAGAADLFFEIYLNGAASGIIVTIPDPGTAGNYGSTVALAIADGTVIGVKASMTGTAVSGSARLGITVTPGL